MTTTLTTAKSLITGATGNLRRLGCRVSTIIDHDPASGRYQYAISVPAGLHPAVVGRPLTLGQQARLFTASIEQHPHDDGAIIVRATAPREVGKPATLQRRIDIAEAVATTLDIVAHRIEQVDRKGSASRQHFIETGLYLTREPGYAISIEEES